MKVSILVLVDFVRNVAEVRVTFHLKKCFNPCFSGFCSECGAGQSAKGTMRSFNPCFSGFCSE